MTNNVSIALTILWEDELRAASRLLREAHEQPDEELRGEMMANAYAACQTALWGLKDDHAIVLLANSEIRRQVPTTEPPSER